MNTYKDTAQNSKVYETTRAYSPSEQKAAVEAIRDDILWEEIHRRYFGMKERFRHASLAFRNRVLPEENNEGEKR